MVRTEPIHEFTHENVDIESRIIDAVGTVGPRNIAEISRITHVHPETVRYKFKKRFNNLGLKFHAEVDYERLGLTLRWGTFRLSSLQYAAAPFLFRLLNKVGYLNYYGKIVPSGCYVARFGVPARLQKEHESLFKWLRDERILSGFNLQGTRISRHVTMNPRFFDFRAKRWEIPWKELGNIPARPLPIAQRGPVRLIDFDDLLILKELQMDSVQHLTTIARRLKINDRTLEYHYRTHVIAKRLVSSYFVRWTQDTSKRLVHSVSSTRLAFHPDSESEMRRIQATVSKIPFLWSEDLLEDGTYVANMYVPSTDTILLLEYLNDELGDMASHVEMEFVRPNEASSYTIPYEMWKDGEWRFDIDWAKSILRKEYRSTLQK